MQIVQYYSHLNGFEYLQYHRPHIWAELESIVAAVDARACRTKLSKETRKSGQTLYSPINLNKAFSALFTTHGWRDRRVTNWLAEDTKLLRKILTLSPEEQKREIEEHGLEPIPTYNQTDFVKERGLIAD